MSFRGKSALITGAGGAIGAAIARRLHAEGAHIIGVDLSQSRLDALKLSIPGFVGVVADVATSEGANAAFEAADGKVHILSNNAGTSDGGGALDELNDDTWRHVIAVNLSSAFLLSRRVIDGMLAAKAGVIINMSSVAGLRGGRTGIAYTSSKWALIGMAQNIAASLGPEGIRAYAVCPGVVTEAVTLGMVPATPRAMRNRGRDRGQPQPTTPDHVADLVAFLASERARHINGIAIPIDQGWLAY